MKKLKKKKKQTCQRADAAVRTTSANVNCVFVFHRHQLHKHGLKLALHSPLIVFVVSGLGLLLIPCGAFGCSVITLNGFHTVTTEFVCVCVCFGLCMCVAAGVHTCQEWGLKSAFRRSLVCPGSEFNLIWSSGLNKVLKVKWSPHLEIAQMIQDVTKSAGKPGS